MSLKVKLVHDEPYSGTDQGDDGRPVDAQPGETITVSDVKGEQLLTDFPKWFKKVGAAAKTPAGDDDKAPAAG